MRQITPCLLSIALACTPVKATATSKKTPPSKNTPDLLSLQNRILERGWDDNLEPGRAKLLTLPKAAFERILDVPSTQTSDGYDRMVSLIFRSTSTPSGLLCLLMTSYREDTKARKSEENLLLLNSAGVLEQAFKISGRLDEDGAHIMDSIRMDSRDPTSPEMQKLLRYELEFWLEGKHRKPEPESKPAPKKKAEPAEKKGK